MPNLLYVSPADDSGSEAQLGFDYQCHCTAKLCIDMIADSRIYEVVCEYQEDAAITLVDGTMRLYQVKKHESKDTWTLDLIKEPLLNLFQKATYKNVSKIALIGNGRASIKKKPSLADLIALLDIPAANRDEEWEELLQPFVDRINVLFKGKLSENDIRRCLHMLEINLAFPHPDAIEAQNREMVGKTIKRIWEIEPSIDTSADAYYALYSRIHQLTKKPKQPHSAKKISRDEAIELLKLPTYRNEAVVDSRTLTAIKLTKGDMEDYLEYAIGKRLDAKQIRTMYQIPSKKWYAYEFEIAAAWQELRQNVEGLSGAILWMETRNLLERLSSGWSEQNSAPYVTSDFAEGVFFNMLGTCSLHLKA